MGEVVQVPWLVKYIRHGSLRMKRLRAHASLALLGLWLFLDTLLGKGLQLLYQAEGVAYKHWLIKSGEWLGIWETPTKPVVTPVLAWVDFAFDLLGILAVVWTFVWIYCDAYCLAAEKCFSDRALTMKDHASLKMRYLTSALARAGAISLATYVGLWVVFICTGGYAYTESLLVQWSGQGPPHPMTRAIADAATAAVGGAATGLFLGLMPAALAAAVLFLLHKLLLQQQ
jgi:hypothetical protein